MSRPLLFAFFLFILGICLGCCAAVFDYQVPINLVTFDGKNSLVVSNFPNFNPNNFTLEIGVKFTDRPKGPVYSTNEFFILSSYDSGTGNGLVIRVGDDIQPIVNFVKDRIVTELKTVPSAIPPNISEFTAPIPIPLNFNTIFHLTRTNGLAKLYYNGHLCGKTITKLGSSKLPITLAGASWTKYGNFIGQIHYLKLYDESLTQETIQSNIWEFEKTININSLEDVNNKRAGLINLIWGTKGWPTRKDLIIRQFTNHVYDYILYNCINKTNENLKRIEEVQINMDYGIKSIGHLFTPVLGNNKLFFYLSGHDSGPEFEDIYTNNKGQMPGLVIPRLISLGYTVFSLGMPIWDKYSYKPTIITPVGSVKLQSHENLFSYVSLPFRYFFEPSIIVINYFQDGPRPFDHIYMIGLSGGGYETTILAALDERINYSFPVAGSLPNYLRINDEGLGDIEQDNLEFFQIAHWQEIYIMGTSNGRSQLQILNEFDPSCFWGQRYTNYVDKVSEIAKNLGGNHEFFSDTSHQEHKVSEVGLAEILKRLICK